MKKEYCKLHSFIGTENESSVCPDCIELNLQKEEMNNPIQRAIDDAKIKRYLMFREAIETYEPFSTRDGTTIAKMAFQMAVKQIYQQWLSLDLRASRTREQLDEEFNRFAEFLNSLI